ncbi:DNA primase [Glutamicibacter phage Montesquieu]|nr:DNA primase [Glutamicibacter phage Montesquieu]
MINRDFTLAAVTAANRDSKNWDATELTWGEILNWAEHQVGSRKECGNYMLGRLKGTRRVKTAVISRSGVTLDIDTPGADFLQSVELLLPECAALVHTTYSSTPDNLRWRLIIPLSREVTPHEYTLVAEALMTMLGRDQFDPGSSQYERYMFKPSVQKGSTFQYEIIEGPALDPDKVMENYEGDLSELPLPTKHQKRDPFELGGTLGAFNRAYDDLSSLVEAFELPYEEDGSGRWKFTGAKAVAGMGEVSRGIFYSHHVTDPAYGKACNAFDLVRIHKFAHLDSQVDSKTPVNRLPSHLEMEKFASRQARVVTELLGRDFADELSDMADNLDPETNTEAPPAAWWNELKLHPKTGETLESIGNWDLLFSHDPVLGNFHFNEMMRVIEPREDFPWRPRIDADVLGEADLAKMLDHAERKYHLKISKDKLFQRVQSASQDRRFHPVRDYLEALEWDGTERLDTCLPGAEDNEYTRMVARKALVAAVARVFSPGVKWDQMMILFGKEGMGKSHWIERMARGFDSSLGKIGDKDTLVNLQRSWIVTSDEGHSLRKADFNQLKEFLTKTRDTFRMPYERSAQEYPRHCVIWGTTNDEVFLRNEEGNRRFLVVEVATKVDFDAMTDEYVDQLWAEAVHRYHEGEKLYLNPTEEKLAAKARERHIAEEPLFGLVRNYLETLVPGDWASTSSFGRQQWFEDRAAGMGTEGTEPINEVCTLQLYMEVMGAPRTENNRDYQIREYYRIMSNFSGWRLEPFPRDVPNYGVQRVFVRIPDDELTATDLI